MHFLTVYSLQHVAALFEHSSASIGVEMMYIGKGKMSRVIRVKCEAFLTEFIKKLLTKRDKRMSGYLSEYIWTQ